MPIRLVAMDLDDTLLRDDLTVSPRVQKAIKEAQAKGVKVTLATGRMPNSARPYAQQLELDLPVITYHGALIQQALSGDVLFRRVIPSALAGKIIEGLLATGVHCQIYLKERVISPEDNEWSREYARLAGVEVESGDLLKILAGEPEGVEKILLMGKEEELEQLRPGLAQEYGGQIHITKSKACFLELTDITVNKGVALAELAKVYGIVRAEVMAIGDSFNDVEMIRYAGVGVAMRNARPEIQAEADFVTSSNEEDGVAEAIERFVLG